MERILSIEGEVPKLDRSITFAKRLQEELPTDMEMEEVRLENLLHTAEQVHFVKREAVTNANLDMREFFEMYKALQRIQGEIINSVAKRSEFDKPLTRDSEKLEEIKDSPSYSEDLKDRTCCRIDDVETNRKARLEVLSMNKKELRSQVTRIKESIAKILDSETSHPEKLKILFREQSITITAILTALGMIISTFFISVTGRGRKGSSDAPPSKDKNKLVEWF